MTASPRRGRPPLMASRVDLRLSVSADLRERLRAESRRTGESEAEIGRQAIEAELIKRANAVWFQDKIARGENAGYTLEQVLDNAGRMFNRIVPKDGGPRSKV